MSNETKGRLISGIQILLGLSLALGMYAFGNARNQGKIPNWVDIALSLAFLALVVGLIVSQAHRAEDKYIGNLQDKAIPLNSGEDILFESSFMSGQFFPAEMAFNPEPSFREWLKGGPIRVRGLLAVQVTNQRLIFGLFLGRTWRVIELSMIRDIIPVNGKWPYRNALLIEYPLGNQIEKILFWTNSSRGQRLKASLEAASVRPLHC